MNMKFKNLIILVSIFFVLTGCQTIKKKSDAIAEKENQKYGKFVGNNIDELNIELGKPTDSYLNETGNNVFVYKSKKYGISCERKFEVNSSGIITGFTSSGCF